MKKIVVMLTTVLLVACQSTDLFDDHAKERDVKAQYAENFSKSYPNVSLNQSWDYSNKNEAYSLPTVTNHAAKRAARAANYQLTTGGEYEVDNSTLTWMKKKLVDGKDNRSLGKPFYMKTPSNSFTIVPIYQGQASSVWELHAVIDGVDFKVWEKCQDVWVKKNENSDWQTVSSVSNTELYKSTDNVAAVKAQSYTFDNVPVGVEMYFYLLVTKVTNSKYNYTVNSQMSSLNGMMLSLNDCPRPANISEDNEVMIIACEDVYDNAAKGVKSDKDMNDVVFMVYGKPEVPSTIEITEDMSIEKKTTVRYMIEDLGATDDFDFNDIVVDVSEIWTSSPVFTNGVLSGWVDSDKHQEAVVRAMGGTIDFDLTIGNTSWSKSGAGFDVKTMYNTQGTIDYDKVLAKFDVTGWNAKTNNVSIKVNDKDGQLFNITFPKSGEVPMIIAVEPTQKWMKERVSVPDSWFYIPE